MDILFRYFYNETVCSDVRECKFGVGRENHMAALKEMLENKLKRGYKDLDTILHTNQGSINVSLPYNYILE